MVQCQGCGHESTKDTYCEMCGAAHPQVADAPDDALSLMLGLVCESCDSYNDPGTSLCAVCGVGLAGDASPTSSPYAAPAVPAAAPPTQRAAPVPAAAPSWMAAPEGQPLATAQAMPAVDLSVLAREGQAGLVAPASSAAPAVPAKSSTSPSCGKCGGDLLVDDKFCRHCGHRVGDVAAAASAVSAGALASGAAAQKADAQKAAATMLMAAAPGLPKPIPQAPTGGATMFMPQVQQPGGAAPSATMFFGAATVERFARLILVKGHTQFGTQWRLQAGKTVIGRNHGLVIFPDDPHLADKHCSLEFRGDELWVVPEATTNGVSVQVRGKAPVPPGGEVVCGSQRFRAIRDEERAPVVNDDDSDTRLYGSQGAALNLVVMRVCADARFSEVYARPQRILSVGRSGCDLNFPDDAYLSTRHAQLSLTDDGSLQVEDLGSRNGTFVRIHGERKLAHGDAIMLGEQVMRVEVSLSVPR